MSSAQTHPLWRDEDHAFFARELASFVPERVFDMHAHLWAHDHPLTDMEGLPGDVGLPEYRRFVEGFHPGRRLAALFLAYAGKAEQVPLNNQWVAQALQQDPDCRGAFFIRPTDDPEWVRQEAKRLGMHGLKCYHIYSPTTPTWEAEIPTYLPEQHVKVAHEEGWTITLHMVKSRAVADPGNIHWIRHYCKTYPDMKLILAHSARGFQPAHNLDGLPQLADLGNLYFDTAVNCDPIAHAAIIRIMGHKRLMYGTDFMVSHLRGRSVCAADSFLWFYEETPVWGEKHMKVKPVFVGLEHLRSIKWACWAERLKDNAVEDIFWNNAAKLMGVNSTRQESLRPQ